MGFDTVFEHPWGSGPYCFRPMRGQLDAFPYGHLKNMNTSFDSNGDPVAFHFLFEKDAYGNEHSERSLLTVTIQDQMKGASAAVKFDLTLDSLPFESVNDGFDVVAQFKVQNMNNNKTFYTDANGLGMQKRILDYRPSWDFTYDYDYQVENVTANYYPVDSAIYIEDEDLRMTILTDRTQGGSSLRDGTIELM